MEELIKVATIAGPWVLLLLILLVIAWYGGRSFEKQKDKEIKLVDNEAKDDDARNKALQLTIENQAVMGKLLINATENHARLTDAIEVLAKGQGDSSKLLSSIHVSLTAGLSGIVQAAFDKSSNTIVEDIKAIVEGLSTILDTKVQELTNACTLRQDELSDIRATLAEVLKVLHTIEKGNTVATKDITIDSTNSSDAMIVPNVHD